MASTGPRKVDIKGLIETWALDIFRRKGTRKEKQLAEKGNIAITIDWKRVKFVTDPISYDPEPKKHGTPKTNILFNTTFTNRTNHPQTYNFRAERTTCSSCSVNIEKAVTTGVEMSVKLTTPCQIMEANAGFRREMTLTNSESETIEEEMCWGVDSQVEVEAGHVGEAKLVILEEKYDGYFTILTRISGTVRVVFTNEKDNNSFVKGIDGKIETIVQEAMRESTWQPTDVISVDKETRSVVCKTVGKCQFKYGVKQMIEVDQKKIDPKAFDSRIDED